MTQTVPDKYKALQKEWKIKEQMWSFLHYGLGISSAVLAAASTGLKAPPSFLSSIDTATLAWASATLAALLTFLSPASKRKAYTEACDHLRLARFRFETQSDALSNAIETAQAMVARK